MKRRFTEDSWRKEPWFRSLCSAFLACKTHEEVANFLRDIATLSEMQAFGERLEVARLLAQGLSYRQVAAKTGASTTTVTRVAHFLENGEGGYRKILKAHRHHRMVHSATAQSLPTESTEESKEIILPSVPETPSETPKVSPLQKYLQR